MPHAKSAPIAIVNVVRISQTESPSLIEAMAMADIDTASLDTLHAAFEDTIENTSDLIMMDIEPFDGQPYRLIKCEEEWLTPEGFVEKMNPQYH